MLLPAAPTQSTMALPTSRAAFVHFPAAVCSQLCCLDKLATVAERCCYLFSALAWLCCHNQVSMQSVGSPTYFLLEGDFKYLLSEVFAAAPLQLTASTEMLRRGGRVLLCLHFLLSLAVMTQKLLDLVALLLGASDGQHIRIYVGIAIGITILDIPVPIPYQTTLQLSGAAFSNTCTRSQSLIDSP